MVVGGADLSPLALAALSLVDEEPRHPYDIHQVMLQRREDRIVKLRPGTLYHSIGKLAEAGLIEEVGTDRDGNRPERTTYRITVSGREVLRSAIAERLAVPREEFPVFVQAVSQAHHLDKGAVLEHLEQRRTARVHHLDEIESGRRHAADDRGTPARYLLDIDLLIHQLRAELAWLDTTISALRSGQLEWTSA